MNIKKLKEAIRKHKSFLITSHINAEGDSIGSQLAMHALLKALGKKSFILNECKPLKQYKFLPYINKIGTNLKKADSYDAVIVLDCPVLSRTGEVTKVLDSRKPIINIDHHISNSYFGDINWVDADASSCGEMMYNLYHAFKEKISRNVALLLYAAISTDTGSFGYENTKARTHLIVNELIKKGLKPVKIYSRIYETKSLSEIKLLQRALATLKQTHGGKVAHLYVSKKMLLISGCNPGATEGFINYPRSIEDVELAVLFLENPYKAKHIQVSFRSKGKISVNKLAARFGGGGHKNAAGCVIKGTLNQAIEKVLKIASAKYGRYSYS